MSGDYSVDASGTHPIKMWTNGVPVEREAMQQLKNIASLPIIFKHVAVMPDVHLGKGATVGSVIPTKGAIIPAAVGVDIGCGMCAAMTNLTARDLPDNLREIRLAIEENIPVGKASHSSNKELPKAVEQSWFSRDLKSRYEAIEAKNPKFATRLSPAVQIGTLGSGNHFIEVCLDTAGRVWVMLHSGSRGIGNNIGTYFISRARDEMCKLFIDLPDRDLAYFAEGTQLFDEYVEAMSWAQDYAAENRKVMLMAVLRVIRNFIPHVALEGHLVNCHHNYVTREHHFGENVWITRKGAVRARVGDLGIIPGSMGTRSYIVEGKGDADSFNSCSHGAGRVMSRTAAKKAFNRSDHEAATRGVECRKDTGVIDETPKAYKDIDAVMAAQSGLVDIKHTLKQVICVKG